METQKKLPEFSVQKNSAQPRQQRELKIQAHRQNMNHLSTHDVNNAFKKGTAVALVMTDKDVLQGN